LGLSRDKDAERIKKIEKSIAESSGKLDSLFTRDSDGKVSGVTTDSM
jgi:hypothetical protein